MHGHSPTVNGYSTHSLEFQRRSRETKRSAIVIVQAREMWAQWGCQVLMGRLTQETGIRKETQSVD